MTIGLPGIATEEAESKVRLLGNAHQLSRTDLGDLALAGGLRLRLLFKLLGLGRDELGKGVAHLRLGADVRPAQPEPRQSFCLMEGVWHNWEKDETITLGCLEVRGNIREGNYSSATGPLAISNFSISGTYDIDSGGSMQIIIKDRQGKGVDFKVPIYVDDTEYPTQLITLDKKREKSLYIWKRKE
jgi:hypothetical protein